jgi:hypothetical protein
MILTTGSAVYASVPRKRLPVVNADNLSILLWALRGFIAISLSFEFFANCYFVIHVNDIHMYASSMQIIQKSNVLLLQ